MATIETVWGHCNECSVSVFVKHAEGEYMEIDLNEHSCPVSTCNGLVQYN